MTKSKSNFTCPVIFSALLLITCSTHEAFAQRGSSGATSSSPRSLGTIGPPAAPSTSPTTPQSMVGTPAPTVPSIAPLSPSLPTQFSTGGTTQNGATGQGSLALSPGASPSESAPSKPGGGGKSLQDCMGFWDRDTHMTKAEWRAACRRTMQEYPTVR
jgi:hypothetical protein